MTGNFEFAFVRVEDRRRDERLNAGIVVFAKDGLEIRLPKRLERLRALSGALNTDSLREDLSELERLDALAREQGAGSASDRIELLSQLTPFTFSKIGSFNAHNADAVEARIAQLMRLMIEPETPPARLIPKRTRLTSALRSALRRERILARKGEGLSAHRVVSNLQIAEGLAADFVLKNGAMHIIETVDANSETSSIRRVISDVAISALVFEQARMNFGENDTKARLVYDASASLERMVSPSLDAAAHQGAELVNWASHDDRHRFIVSMSSLAEPLPTKREERMASLHASTQSKLALN